MGMPCDWKAWLMCKSLPAMYALPRTNTSTESAYPGADLCHEYQCKECSKQCMHKACRISQSFRAPSSHQESCPSTLSKGSYGVWKGSLAETQTRPGAHAFPSFSQTGLWSGILRPYWWAPEAAASPTRWQSAFMGNLGASGKQKCCIYDKTKDKHLLPGVIRAESSTNEGNLIPFNNVLLVKPTDWCLQVWKINLLGTR